MSNGKARPARPLGWLLALGIGLTPPAHGGCPPALSITSASPGSGQSGNSVTIQGSGFGTTAGDLEVFVWDGTSGLPLDVTAASSTSFSASVGRAGAVVEGSIIAALGTRSALPSASRAFNTPRRTYLLTSGEIFRNQVLDTGSAFSLTQADTGTFSSELDPGLVGGILETDLSGISVPPANITVRIVVKTGPAGGGSGGGTLGPESCEGEGEVFSGLLNVTQVVDPAQTVTVSEWMDDLAVVLDEQLGAQGFDFARSGSLLVATHSLGILAGYLSVEIH